MYILRKPQADQKKSSLSFGFHVDLERKSQFCPPGLRISMCLPAGCSAFHVVLGPFCASQAPVFPSLPLGVSTSDGLRTGAQSESTAGKKVAQPPAALVFTQLVCRCLAAEMAPRSQVGHLNISFGHGWNDRCLKNLLLVPLDNLGLATFKLPVRASVENGSCRASQRREARAESPRVFLWNPLCRFLATLVRLDAYLSKDVLLMARSRDMTRRTPLPVRTWQMPFDGAIVSHRPPSFTGTSSPEVRSATVTRANSPEAGSHVLAAPGAWG